MRCLPITIGLKQMRAKRVKVSLAVVTVIAATIAVFIIKNSQFSESVMAIQGEHKMPIDAPKQVALKWVAAYNSHNADDAAALYDVNVTNVQMPYGKPVQGREAMHATYVKVFQAFPDIHVQVENLVENDQWVAVEWMFSGTMKGEFAGHPPNNSHFTIRGCELFQVMDGKIHVQRGYWDKATMFSQLNIQ